MARSFATVERLECSICRRPIDVTRALNSVAIFDPGDRSKPHRCPAEALIRYRQLYRMARWGDPKAKGFIKGVLHDERDEIDRDGPRNEDD